MGKRTAQKDTIIDITSDSQVNSNFLYRWSPTNRLVKHLTTIFYLFLYLYITRTTINNKAPHLKSSRNQNRRAALGQPAMKLLGGGVFNLFVVDQPSPLVLPWFIRQNNYNESITLQNKNKQFRNTKHLFYLFSFFYYKA